MVVGHRDAARDDDSGLFEHGEEFLRPGDAGQGEDTRAGEGGDLGAGDEVSAEDREGELIGGAGAVRADEDGGLAAGGGGLDGFTQGAGGKDVAVAEAALAVDYQQGQVFVQGRVLQPVIHDEDVRPGLDGEAGGGGPVGTDPGRGGPGKEQGLVADEVCGVVGLNGAGGADAAAVASGEQVRPATEGGQVGGEVEHNGGLAGAAHGGVADADDGDGGVPAGAGDALGGGAGGERAEGRKQAGEWAVGLPEGGRLHRNRPSRVSARRAGRWSWPATAAAARLPAAVRAAGSASMAPTQAAIDWASVTMRRASAERRMRTGSAKLAVNGPVATAQARRAGSRGFWPPPGGTRLRPTRAIGARRYQRPSSFSVSAIQIWPGAGVWPAERRAPLVSLRDGRASLRVARHEDGGEVGVGGAQGGVGGEDDFVLTGMQAGGDPGRASGQGGAGGGEGCLVGGQRLGGEFQIAGGNGVGCAEGGKAGGVLGTLRVDQVEAVEDGAGEAGCALPAS